MRLSLPSLIQLLATIQQAPVQFVRGNRLAAKDVRRLADSIDSAASKLKELEKHPPLLQHLLLAMAAEFVVRHDVWLTTTTALESWLDQPIDAQHQWLSERVKVTTLMQAQQQLNTSSSLNDDEVIYLQQQAQRILWHPPAIGRQHTVEQTTAVAWHLILPENYRPALRFHLLQIGQQQGAVTVCINAHTITSAMERGYTVGHIEHYLQPTAAQRAQLKQWVQSGQRYQLRAGWVLHTPKPEDLDQMMQNRTLRRYVHVRHSPAYATVSPEIQQPLRRWLNKQDVPFVSFKPPAEHRVVDAASSWLGVRLLLQLQTWVPTQTLVAQRDLAALSSRLDEVTLAELDQKANTLLADLTRVIDGTDTFFAPSGPIHPATVIALEQAISAEATLTIVYRKQGAAAAQSRLVTPQWIERRDELAYLHVYCHSAEAPRVFRLDRIEKVDSG